MRKIEPMAPGKVGNSSSARGDAGRQHRGGSEGGHRMTVTFLGESEWRVEMRFFFIAVFLVPSTEVAHSRSSKNTHPLV